MDLETTFAYRHRLGFTNSVKPSAAAWLQKIFGPFFRQAERGDRQERVALEIMSRQLSFPPG